MMKTRRKALLSKAPATLDEAVRAILDEIFGIFKSDGQAIAKHREDFKKRRDVIREEMEHGARKTTGRIV